LSSAIRRRIRFRLPAVAVVAALTVGGLGAPAAAAHATVVPTATVGASVTRAALLSTRQRLDIAVRAFLAKRPGSLVGVAVYDRRTGATYTYRGGTHFKTASVVKVQVLAAVLYRAQRLGRGLTSWEKSNASAMIRRSDNDATNRLYGSLGGAGPVRVAGQKLGMVDTTVGANGWWGLTSTTAADQATRSGRSWT